MDAVAIDEMAAFEDRHWWFVGKRLLVRALLGGRFDRPGLRILDVGCGTGGLLAEFRGRARMVGVDRSHHALAYCARRGLAAVAMADAHRLPFPRASFDGVLLLDVLEHFADEGQLLGEVRRVLRPGGTVLVSVPAFQFLWSQHDVALQHVRRYTARRLRAALTGAGIEIERITYTNTVAFPPAFVVRGILPRLGWRRSAGDFKEHAPWVNQALVAAYRLEAAAVPHCRLPVGLSVAAVGRS